jgi:GNAT superfamily N-acetyltransferase
MTKPSSSATPATRIRQGRLYNAEIIRPKADGAKLRYIDIDPGDTATLNDIHHFKKMVACEALSVDARWRDQDSYGPEVTDSYLRDDFDVSDSENRLIRAQGMQNSHRIGARRSVACYDGKRLVGVCSLTDWSHYGEEYANLGTQVSAMYVLPGYERLGIASGLLARIEQKAQQSGLPCLYLEATKGFEGFYEKHGYQHAPEDDTHYDLSGSTIIGALMYKDLARKTIIQPETAAQHSR